MGRQAASPFTVTDLPLRERPRERLISQGPAALSEAELMAILLGRGTAGESVLTLVQKLLSKFRSLEGIAQASVEDLMSIHGVGVAKATQLKACTELARRLEQRASADNSARPCTTPEAIAAYIRPHILKYSKEHCVLISLDTRKRIIGTDTISVGTLNASLIHPREIFETAIHRHAAAVVLAHNHPSGDPTPSRADAEVTTIIRDAGRILDIELLDHVIVTRTQAVSLRSLGLL